ncbi:asparagine synthase-related protein (plasmid) [Natrinema zhouii]|uniref:asparagine synthase-related protein n=1 Tax=Natrinema zhouii TaxID=1710539 RepID=UPI001CFF9070|nr:asparagine synthase-related protein [Natrinema zhouii]UHQ98604.1 asparagine synthase-related protein [Natrinema zhouii]
MVGLCGAVSDICGIDPLVEDLHWTGDERSLLGEEGDVAVASVTHPFEADLGYAETEGGDRIWLWGSVWGFDGPDGYERFRESGAEQCAIRYDRHGMEFVSGLNGNFVGAIHDSETGQLSLFTDRFGTRPLYYSETDDGIVFSTNIQSLPLHPGVETEFDETYLAEYFALHRPFGVRTPLTGVAKTQPGSVMTIDPDGSYETHRYWRPVYTPRERSREYFADRLARTFRDVVADRTDRAGEYGLLLSGGSDSRLVLAALTALDRQVQTFHLAEWHNREAKTAAKVSAAAGAPLTLLIRDGDYLARSLTGNSEMSNFVGYFNQAHANEFDETLSSSVDVLLTGHYGDMLFKGNHLRKSSVDLGPLGSFDLPRERSIETVEEFVDHRADVNTPAYLQLPRSIRELYRDDVRKEGEEVIDHGVSYPSLREATLASRCPLTNGTSQFFYHGTSQMMPSGTPFLDNRLFDLFLTIPVRHLLRGDLINEAISRLAPALADYPHGSGVVPVRYPLAAQRTGELATEFVQKHLLSDPEKPHWGHGPWPDHHELIRTQEFIPETLERHEETIRSLPFLSWEGANECYEAHLAGESHLGPLYSLVTFLEMPLVSRVQERQEATH